MAFLPRSTVSLLALVTLVACSRPPISEGQPGTVGVPSPRTNASAAYDLATRTVIMFGGADRTGVLDETWIWDGKTWRRQSLIASPAPRQSPVMAFDPESRRIILYGGNTCPSPKPDEPIGCEYQKNSTALTDTWAWDGHGWSQLAGPPGPQVRDFGGNEIGATADETRRQLILVAHGVTDPDPSAETWIFHDGRWRQLHPLHAPWFFNFDGPAFDPTSGRVVIGNPPGPHIDCGTDPKCKPYAVPAAMWAWTGSDWQELSSSPKLPFSFDSLVSTAHGLMLVGDSEQFQWNGSTWDAGRALPWGYPPLRTGWAVAYDAASRTVLVYGGRFLSRNHLFGDLLSWDGRQWETLGPSPSSPSPVGPLASCTVNEALAGEDYGPDSYAISFIEPLRGPCHLAITVQFTLIGADGASLPVAGNPSLVRLDKDLTYESRTTRVRFTIAGSCRLVEGDLGRFTIGEWQLSEPVFGMGPCDGPAQPLSVASSVATVTI